MSSIFGDHFTRLLENDKELAPAIAAIDTLIFALKQTTPQTLSELNDVLKRAEQEMKETKASVICVTSGCDMFRRFVALARTATLESEHFRDVIIERGARFLQKVKQAKFIIAQSAQDFIPDSCNILVHSFSRVVLTLLKTALEKNVHVYITECSYDHSGYEMKKELDVIGIKNTIIQDASVGQIMHKIHMVLFGAEAITEDGGIINKIGTLTIAICAYHYERPVYVAAETFKFISYYPFDSFTLKPEMRFSKEVLKGSSDLSKEFSQNDYTPGRYIKAVFTDIGVLSPSAVTEEIFRLYR